MPTPLISFNDVSFQYIEASPSDGANPKVCHPVLDHISFTVNQGEFVAILGANGSGKSTLAKLCNGMLTPQQGSVTVQGMKTTDADNLLNIRKTIGMVFQNPDNQIVATLVEEDVAFAPENLGVDPKEIRKRVDQALKDVHMYSYRSHPPHKLSGGQKQRVAIAGVLAMKPTCIILDESTAMLDPAGREEVMRIICELHKKGTTIIHITHFMEEAVFADRVMVLKGGSIALDASPGDAFRQEEMIKKAGLDLPEVTQLSYLLQKKGIPISPAFTLDQLISQLCSSLGGAA